MRENLEQDAFLRYFLPAQPSLRGYLLAVLRDPVSANDVFQEVSSVLWRKFDEFDQSRNFAAWAMGIAKMQVRRQRQREARSRLVFSDETVDLLATVAGESPMDEDARLAYLAGCLNKLPPNHKNVVALRFQERASLADIAVRIGKNVAAVEMLMVRLRRALRKCVDESMKAVRVAQTGTV
jgi:RNA polymerase sigma-70 factor (ECF subfamily)